MLSWAALIWAPISVIAFLIFDPMATASRLTYEVGYWPIAVSTILILFFGLCGLWFSHGVLSQKPIRIFSVSIILSIFGCIYIISALTMSFSPVSVSSALFGIIFFGFGIVLLIVRPLPQI